jgi:hypothetical protein
MSYNPNIVSFTGHIETTVQALRLIHAANRGIIPLITLPLNDTECRAIKSGTVFVFRIEGKKNAQWTGMSFVSDEGQD